MKRMLLGAVGFAVSGILVFPAASGAQTADRDSVTGTASQAILMPPNEPPITISYTFNASSGPSGENPTGTVVINVNGNLSPENVTCLAVTGNRAVIGANGPLIIGMARDFAFTVADGGPTGQDALGVELASTTCATTDGSTQPISGGDIVVHDAQPPLPTTISACLHDGFAQFGFSNAGRCVTFVVQTRICGILDRYWIKTKFCPPTPPARP